MTPMHAIWVILVVHSLTASAPPDYAAPLTSGGQPPLAAPKANRHDPARQRFRDARSFYTYYSGGRIAELSRYDVAILHTPMMASDDVKRLTKLGVVTIGYLAIGEDKKLQVGNGQGPGGKASWYFDRDGDNQPDQNPIWKSWYANTNDLLWRADRVAEAKRLIEKCGFEGLFLDVLSVSELYPDSRPGMRQMIRDLREALPEAVIVMNQGFDIVAEVASLADGFMLESFTATYDFEMKKYALHDPASLDGALNRATKLLNPVIEMHPLRVLVLDYALPTDRKTIQFAANRAASLGYLFSISPIMLDDVYADIPVGEVDDKWLRRHSTPDKLAHKLAEPRNGFPAGTVITPSGCYAGYSVKAIVDPAIDRSGHSWRQAAWASAEDGDASWLRIDLPRPRSGGSLAIAWHDAAGPSREFQIQVRQRNDMPWQDVESISDNSLRTSKHVLPDAGYRQIRIVQPADGGSAGRPGLMWITRIELAD